MTKSEWFPGEGRNGDEEVFLARLRAHAQDSDLVDARPEDTEVATEEGYPLVVLVPVPKLQDLAAKPTLQVGFDLAGWGRDVPFLAGAWETHGFFFDSVEGIDLDGVPPTPEGMAHRAFDWLTEQLCRPVERLEWTSGPWPPRIETRLRDPDEPLVLQRSGWPFRRWRGGPDQVTRLR